MRTIVLIEADHNLNNKLLGKRAMAYSEQHHALAPEQYGDHFPLDLPWNLWGFLATPTWITSTWQSLFSFNLSITDTTTSPPPLRHDDQLIMEYLLLRVQDQNTLRILNHCRLYLRLFWLSELHTTSGTHLLPSLLRGSPSTTSSPLHHWPCQGQPTQLMWTLWNKTLI